MRNSIVFLRRLYLGAKIVRSCDVRSGMADDASARQVGVPDREVLADGLHSGDVLERTEILTFGHLPVASCKIIDEIGDLFVEIGIFMTVEHTVAYFALFLCR